MNTLKKFIKKYFQYFSYFYSHLGNRIFVSFSLSVFVGVMDGLGLAMFIPLLQMTESGKPHTDNASTGNMSFLYNMLHSMGIPITLGYVLIILLVFFSLKGVMRFAEIYARVIFEQYFIKNIRLKNIRGLSDFSFKNFIVADIGRIQNTFSGEVEKVKQAYRYYFIALQYGVFVAVYVTMAFLSNPKFVMLVIVGGAATNILFRTLQKKTKILSQKITVDSHVFQGLLIQKVAFFKYLKSTGLIHKYANKLEKTNDLLHNAQRKSGLLSAILAAVREPVVILVVVIAIIIQVNYLHQGIGVIIFTLLLFYRALISLTGMQSYTNYFIGTAGSLQNMTAFNEELKTGKEIVGAIKFDKFNNVLELKDLSFSFEETVILNEINLSIQKNETIAIVGESGSGKTTLINLITGLFKPTKGQILIDGVDLETINTPTYQGRIGYITQEAVVFNDTIFNNISFWDEQTPRNLARFEEAIKKASIYEFVMSQPLKADALLGNNGINVSGGQKQRISIARELYKEVDFLFMDEATSALDSETESEIQENIEKLKGKYTIVIVAHRLSTIKNADRIILLNKGSINAVGSFDHLIQTSALFGKMVQLQGF